MKILGDVCGWVMGMYCGGITMNYYCGFSDGFMAVFGEEIHDYGGQDVEANNE